jgi:RNA polymerase sigma factor (sigma-70 family)
VHVSKDPTKLLSLFTAQRGALARFLARRVGNIHTAEDLVQETWLKLTGSAAPAAVANPQAYLFRVAANLAIDHNRAEARRRLAPSEIDGLLEIPDDAPDPAAIVEGHSEMVTLRQALFELPERCRKIFVLARIEGLPHRDIAQRFNISRRMVEHEILRALDHCAARLGRSIEGRFTSRRSGSS